jgi:Tfp pilus assembly protein PilN
MRRGGFGAEDVSLVSARASSPDQLSVIWDRNGAVVTAMPIAGGMGGNRINIDFVRYPSDFNLAAAVNMRRSSQSNLPAVSPDTQFHSVVNEYSERTRILALDGEKLAMNDDELAEWLIQAEQQMYLGTDNHPLFETSLEDTACMLCRLPNGQVTLTEVPRGHVNAVRDRLRPISLIDPNRPYLNATIETPVRSVTRYFLTAFEEGKNSRRQGKDREVTAIMLISRTGFSFGLWSPNNGLFNEYSFLAPKDLARGEGESKGAPDRFTPYVRRAFDQLFLQLTQEKLEQLDLAGYAQLVWACDAGLADSIAPIAAEYVDKAGLDVFQMPVPADEAMAGGLLTASYNFGEPVPIGASILPPVNLARDLMALADSEESERRRLELVNTQARRNRALFTILAAPVVVVALILAFVASLVREQIVIAVRDARADARMAELKPALDRRRSYEANLKWYQEFITQVSELRKQQPVGIGMLYQLNTNYPLNLDPAFYVSDMRLSPAGDVELRGLARNKDAVATFLKTLEFAGGSESGSRLFSDLTYEVQESAGATTVGATRPGMPAMTGSTLTGTGSTAVGTVSWSMRGKYNPLVAFAPPDPNAKPPAAPAAAPPLAAK